MPWVGSLRYDSLLRAAGKRLSDSTKDEYSRSVNNAGMLLWRLDPSRSKPITPDALWFNPFEHLTVVDVDTKMLIFIVHHGKGIIFEDDHSIFPSDELVAKLRILLA